LRDLVEQYQKQKELRVGNMSSRRSSGSYSKHHGFNPIQIKNGMIVRLRKDGTIKTVLGKYGEYKGKKEKSA